MLKPDVGSLGNKSHMVVMNCFLLCGCARELKTDVTRTAVLKKKMGYCLEVDSRMP